MNDAATQVTDNSTAFGNDEGTETDAHVGDEHVDNRDYDDNADDDAYDNDNDSDGRNNDDICSDSYI